MQDRIANLVTAIDSHYFSCRATVTSCEAVAKEVPKEKNFLREHAMPIPRYPSEIEAGLYPNGIEAGLKAAPSIFLVSQPKSGTV